MSPTEPKLIGEVTHYYGNIGVAVVKFNTPVAVHTKIKFVGAHTDLEENLDSMQYDHKQIEKAEAGQEVGIKVNGKVHEHDRVYWI